MGSSSSSSASAFGGSAGGWVKERFLRQRRYIADLTVNAEDTNAIAVDVQMRTYAEDSTNEYVDADEAVALEAHLVDANGKDALAAAWTMAETGDGTEVSTTAKPRLIATSSSTGACQLTVTDVSGASTDTIYLFIRPLNAPGYTAYTALTFA